MRSRALRKRAAAGRGSGGCRRSSIGRRVIYPSLGQRPSAELLAIESTFGLRRTLPVQQAVTNSTTLSQSGHRLQYHMLLPRPITARLNVIKTLPNLFFTYVILELCAPGNRCTGRVSGNRRRAIDGESKVAVPEMVSRSKVVMEPTLASLTELMGPDHGNLPPDAA